MEWGPIRYHCRFDSTRVLYHDQIRNFHFSGRHGNALFCDEVINTFLSDQLSRRQFSTGIYLVRDVFCGVCGQELGWYYERAEDPTQAYKERKFVLELHCLMRYDGFNVVGNLNIIQDEEIDLINASFRVINNVMLVGIRRGSRRGRQAGRRAGQRVVEEAIFRGELGVVAIEQAAVQAAIQAAADEGERIGRIVGERAGVRTLPRADGLVRELDILLRNFQLPPPADHNQLNGIINPANPPANEQLNGIINPANPLMHPEANAQEDAQENADANRPENHENLNGLVNNQAIAAENVEAIPGAVGPALVNGDVNEQVNAEENAQVDQANRRANRQAARQARGNPP